MNIRDHGSNDDLEPCGLCQGECTVEVLITDPPGLTEEDARRTVACPDCFGSGVRLKKNPLCANKQGD